MKLEFKFSGINIVSFLALAGLVYWWCPLPAAPVWRAVVCGGIGAVLFGMCFVVVSHRGIFRPAPAKPEKKQRKRKK